MNDSNETKWIYILQIWYVDTGILSVGYFQRVLF
jgi:hypothetical protein